MDGPEGVRAYGHRQYVGGLWDEVGMLQFEFLVAQGLKPEHVLLDIGCGSLRGAVRFIPYLDRGNYLGIEAEPRLIRAGLRHELPRPVRREKRPELIVSGQFEFGRFSRTPDFAIAQSLFSHLPRGMIVNCLTNLTGYAPECVLFATFFETEEPIVNPPSPGEHINFHYTRSEMAGMADDSGWGFSYIGDWSHPRGQIMTRFAKARTPTT